MSLHTLHVRGLSRNLGFFEAQKVLKSFFELMFVNQVSQIHVISNYDVLMDLINEKFRIDTAYNQYKQKNLSYNERIMITVDNQLVDAEIYYENLIKINEGLLNFYRKLNSKTNSGNLINYLGNAFVSFKNYSIVENILKNKKMIFEKKNTFNGKILSVKVLLILLGIGSCPKHQLLVILSGRILSTLRLEGLLG